MGKSEVRIQLDGPFEHLQSIIHIFAAHVISSTQIDIVSLSILGRPADDGFFFVWGESDAKRLSDAPSDFLLNGENVLEMPIVTLGPDGMPCRNFNQLGRDPHATASATDATFEQITSADPQ